MDFINLHCHTNIGSPYDALGGPKNLIDGAIKKGMEAIAITDHGNMNALAEAYLYERDLRRGGSSFRFIKGVELYYIDSVRGWEEALGTYNKIKDKKSLGASEHRVLTAKIKERRHIVVWATNYQGYKNLCSIISESHRKPYYYKRPRVDFDLLSKYSSGLAGSSACVLGVINGPLFYKLRNGELLNEEDYRWAELEHKKFHELFGGKWFGELQWHKMNEQNILNRVIIEVSKKLNIPLITTCDVHYVDKHESFARNLYVNSRFEQSESGEEEEIEPDIEESGGEDDIDLSLKSGSDIYEDFLKFDTKQEFDRALVKESISNTVGVLSLIEDFEIDTKPKMPSFILDKYNIFSEKDEEFVIQNLCEEELKRLGKYTPEYLERLGREIELIKKKNFVKYFLTMREIVSYAKRYMGTGVARGSAAGSLVSYLLGITSVDPIRFGLSFSRFLTYDSIGFPDIDFDCEEPKKLKDILIREWGENKIIYVSNWNLLSFKTVVKDLSKKLKIPFQEVNTMTKKAIEEYRGSVPEEEILPDPDIEEILRYSASAQDFFKKHPELKVWLDYLKGNVRDISRHAGGVIIGDDLFSDMPVIRSGNCLQTPWPEGQNKRLLEPMGFIKFDILGIATLSEIFETLKKILGNRGLDTSFSSVMRFYEEKLLPDNLNLQINSVYKNIFHRNNFVGVFQFSGEGIKRLCSSFKPENITELAIISAVYRPGPLKANVDKDIIEAKFGNKKPKTYCKEFEEVTKDTYGFLIFQEQISELMCKIIGISEDEGQKVRKLLTKKKGGDMEKLKPYRDLFFKTLSEQGINESDVNELWDVVVAFAGYGFNKSHAISYAIISYQCAVLLNFYPNEWISSVLDVEFPAKRWKLLSSILKQGYEMEKFSEKSFTTKWIVSDKKITPPVIAVRGIGEEVCEFFSQKIKNGELSSTFDIYLLYIGNKTLIKKNVLIKLLEVGVFDNILKVDNITSAQFKKFLEGNKKPILSRQYFYSVIETCKKERMPNIFSAAQNIYALSGILYTHDIYFYLFNFLKEKDTSLQLPSYIYSVNKTGKFLAFVIDVVVFERTTKVLFIDENGNERAIFFNGGLFAKPKIDAMNILKIKKNEKNNYFLEGVYVVESSEEKKS